MTRSVRPVGVVTPVALATLRFATLPAAAHGADHSTGHTPWTLWAAIVALVVGVVLVGVGIFVDRRRDERDPRSDTLVVVGTVASLVSMAVFWL